MTIETPVKTPDSVSNDSESAPPRKWHAIYRGGSEATCACAAMMHAFEMSLFTALLTAMSDKPVSLGSFTEDVCKTKVHKAHSLMCEEHKGAIEAVPSNS